MPADEPPARGKLSPEARKQHVLDRLRALREERGLSQEALGAALGQTGTWASRIELGALRLRVITLFQLLDALDAELADVFGVADGPKSEAEAELLEAARAMGPNGPLELLAIAKALSARRGPPDPFLAVLERLTPEERARFAAMADAFFHNRVPKPPEGT